MLFSSVIFLFLFLPLTLGGYFLVPSKYKNAFLVIMSLIFYGWGEPRFVFIILLSILFNYTFALLIEHFNQNRLVARVFLIISIFMNVGLLVFYKYSHFLFGGIYSHLPAILLPLGISFFTFHAMSYCIDVYRKDVAAQKNIINIMLYFSFFPQMIAGPIVRYKTIAGQIITRKIASEDFAYGIERFIKGLSKKLLVADTMGRLSDTLFSLPTANLTSELAWCAVIAYTLQIYFDFSGYSDMAIGLARMLGFTFPENFNLPYVAESLQDFWRRWHISLSTWFRDYLYIPLGGNRRGDFRTYINLLIVFFLVGLWHGAAWTFVVWGLWHGTFLILERTPFGKILARSWRPVRHIYTMLVVMIGWTLFRSSSFTQAYVFLQKMFFMGSVKNVPYPLLHYLSPWIITMALFGIIFSIKKSFKVNVLFYLGLLLLCSMAIANGTYNNFIYFKF